MPSLTRRGGGAAGAPGWAEREGPRARPGGGAPAPRGRAGAGAGGPGSPPARGGVGGRRDRLAVLNGRLGGLVRGEPHADVGVLRQRPAWESGDLDLAVRSEEHTSELQ